MQKYKNILVVADPEKEQQPAESTCRSYCYDD